MKPLLIFSSIILFMSCSETGNTKKDSPDTSIQSNKKLEQANWLLGRWHNVPVINSPTEVPRELTEIWIKENDSTYSAESFIVSAKDTVFHEIISLEQRGQDLQYIVNVNYAKEKAPVSFLLTSADSTSLVFENPLHDFPSRITYTRIGKDSLYAEISGIDKGQQQKIGYPYKRVQIAE